MLGLMVFGSAALYLALTLIVMGWAWRRGRANGGSALKATLFAVLGLLLVYLPVFWNHIPVLLTHRSMCAEDAGFKAHMRPEQWADQNHEAIGKLTKQEIEKQERASVSIAAPDGFRREVYFGGLLVMEWRGTTRQVLNRVISKDERRVRDALTNQILATYTDYSANGHSDDISGWIFPSSCFDTDKLDSPKHDYYDFRYKLRRGK